MRRSKFSEKQIIDILKEVEDGAPVVETLRNKGVIITNGSVNTVVWKQVM
jgi:hypothetical protein